MPSRPVAGKRRLFVVDARMVARVTKDASTERGSAQMAVEGAKLGDEKLRLLQPGEMSA
jgi:hypothetical protein